ERRVAVPGHLPCLEQRIAGVLRNVAAEMENEWPADGHRHQQPGRDDRPQLTPWNPLALHRRGRLAAGRSENRQVSVELPARDLDAVLVPLLALDLDVALEHVLAERPEHELRLRGQLDRLAERLRQLLDPQPAALVG